MSITKDNLANSKKTVDPNLENLAKESFTITELSALLNVTDHTLRYYEKEFNLRIPRDSRGRRYYTPELSDIFLEIRKMRDEGYEIKVIKELMTNNYCLQPVEANPSDSMQSNLDLDNIKKLLSDLEKQLHMNILSGINSSIDSSSIHIINEISKSNEHLSKFIETNNTILDAKLERHFQSIDNSLSEWRNKNKCGAIKQLFQRIGILPY